MFNKRDFVEVPLVSPLNNKFHIIDGMINSPQQLIVQYASCPESQTEYETDGKKYKVTRHFTGDKSINQVIYSIAESRADREMGLT